MYAFLDEFVSFRGGMGHITRDLVMLERRNSGLETRIRREIVPRYPLCDLETRMDVVDCRLLVFAAD